MMKKIKKTMLMIFALILGLSVSVEVALAYFSDYEQASGGATLHLGGKTEMTEGQDTGKKDVVIKNTGKTNMIVRVGIYGPDEMDAPVMKGKWMRSSTDGMYYYGEVLKPGETTGEGNLVASMSFKWKGEAPDYNYEVTVVHEGCQAIYNGDKLKTPNGWDTNAVAKIQLPASE